MRILNKIIFKAAAFFCVVALAGTSSLAGTGAVRSTSGRIGLMQVFDFYIPPSTKVADGPLYDFVWGSWAPSPWYANQPSLIASRYGVFERDAGSQDFNSHPDWVLYNCAGDGTPTHVPAYMQAGLYGTATPVDIHNPAVISDWVHRFAFAAIANGYNALAIDQVVFQNIMGGNAGAGSYGCGIWQGSTFVRRYASKADGQWALDVVNWVKTAKSIISTDPGLARYRLKVVINHPTGAMSSKLEQQLLANTDMTLNESGFSNYGNYTKSSTNFIQVLNYMVYVQARGVTALIIDKFVQGTLPLSPIQREWALATYLLGNNGNALFYATSGGAGSGGYGTEHYYPEYGTNLGAACGTVTASGPIYQRKFANGLVIVNSDTSAHSASLPLREYHDIDGRAVTNPLLVPPTDAFVLTTLPATGCL